MASAYFLVLIVLCSVICFNDEVKADCGGVIFKTNGTITSPGYPSNYPPNLDCTWEIKAPPNFRIIINFKLISLEYHDLCGYDSLTLTSKMGDGSFREHGKFCGQTEIPNIISESNILLIEFKSDGGTQSEGFELEFSTVSAQCGGLIERSEGVITSPLFPFPYPPESHCTWTIQAPLKYNIKLKFTNFSTEEYSGCNSEYVSVQSKMTGSEIQQHGKFCGSEAPPIILSKSNIMLMQFVSNSTSGLENKGFRAEFSFEGCGGVIEGGKGNISTPFYPNPYPPNKNCEWTFLVPPQHKLKLHFLDFEFEGGDDCRNDFLYVQSNSIDGKIRDYGKYCSFIEPSLITSEDSLLLKFVSDRSIQRRGFKAEYFIDKFTEFESSTLTKSTAPVYELFNSTVMNQYDDISTESVTSRNEDQTFSDEYASTISSVMTSSTSVRPTNLSKTEKQPKEAENLMRNETNILSALTVLTKKIASIENKQILLFNILNVLAEKAASFEERQMIFFNNFEKSINEVNRLLKLKSRAGDYWK